MSLESLASILILLMPVSFLIKTVVFLTLFLILIRQTSETWLGRWIVAMFFCTFLASAVVTELAWYLARVADPRNVDSIEEWVIICGAVVAPLLVAISGVMVVRWNRKLSRRHPAR